jgi:hypothetical protein
MAALIDRSPGELPNTFTAIGGSRVSSGATSDFASFSLPSASSRYVRILGRGSDVNTVNAYTASHGV